MNEKVPSAGIVASTVMNSIPLHQAEELGIPNPYDWTSSEDLVVFAGKLCYLAFDETETPNLNITKVRQDRTQYIANLLNQGHGSVLEHASVSVLFTNVSRVLTHELVRHRAGMAYSQTSGRYVRTGTLDMTYIPADPETHHEFVRAATMIDQLYRRLMNKYDWDNMDFTKKKKLTSYLRRLLPNGQTTHILVTGNHRAWRHIFNMRCTEHAEIEINNVLGELFTDFKQRWPAIYQDMEMERMVDERMYKVRSTAS